MALDLQPVTPTLDLQPVEKKLDIQPAQKQLDIRPASLAAQTDDQKPFIQAPSWAKLGRAAVAAAKDTAKSVYEPILKMGDVAMHPSHIVGKNIPETVSNIVNQLTPLLPVAPELKLSGALDDIESAAIRDPATGKILAGDNHPEIAKTNNLPGTADQWHADRQNAGFVLKNGEFINRDQAKAKYGIDHSEELKAAKAEQAGALKAKQVAQNTADDLFQNANMKLKDEIEMTQKLKQLQGIQPETFEKLQRYEESGKTLPLTPAEQKLYDDFFAPIEQESKEHVEYLKSHGGSDYELQANDYTPRQVKGAGSPTDRLLERAGPPKNLKGKSISTFAHAAKNRAFFAIETPEGRKVVYADPEGQIFDAANKDKPIGFIEKGTKPSAGAEAEIMGKPTTLRTAKIPEIEQATGGKIQYHKNLLATRVTNLLQLRRARRNLEMIERWKQDPEFNEQMRWRGSNEETPRDFRHVNGLPREFEGAKFSPHLAEQLEDFLPRIKNDDALSQIEKIGRFTRASIFFWPVTHMGNVTYQYFMSKGLLGTLGKLPTTVADLASGFRAVATQNKEFMRILSSGASLPYAGEVARQFPDELLRAMQGELTRNPQGMAKIAAAFGYGNPVQMVKNVYALSSKALWSYGDALMIARVKELERAGLSTAEAIKEADRVIPDYRVPARVAGQRWLSQAIQNPLTAEFGRYQYNVLKSFAEVWGKIKDPATRARGLDQAAFVAFMAAIGYPLLDKLAQKVTGNPNAEFKKSGAGKALQNALDVPMRKKNVRQAIMSSASPGMMTAPLEALMNTNLYTGAPIYNDQDLQQGKFGRVASDLGKFAVGQVGPLQPFQAVGSNKTDAERFLESLFMIQNPTPAQVNARAKAQNYLLKQQGRAAGKRGF